jgi:hypothetical protein
MVMTYEQRLRAEKFITDFKIKCLDATDEERRMMYDILSIMKHNLGLIIERGY